MAFPSVDVSPYSAVVLMCYYSELGTYPQANNSGGFDFKLAWGQPLVGAVRNGWAVEQPAGDYTDPVTGFQKINTLPDRCDVTVENDPSGLFAQVTVDGCSTPVVSPDEDGIVEPVPLVTILVFADTAAGFTSQSVFTEISATRWSDGAAAKAPRGGLSEIAVVE